MRFRVKLACEKLSKAGLGLTQPKSKVKEDQGLTAIAAL